MIRYVAGAATLALVVACGFGWSGRADAQDAGWGTVKGQIVFGGAAVPERKKLDVNKDQAQCLAKGPLLSEEWVVNKSNKGVRWAFVWLGPEDPKGKLPIHPSLEKIKDKDVSMDQPCCQFEPHALGMRAGQNLVAKNSSTIAHNVNWAGRPQTNPGGNVIVPAGKAYVIEGLKADKFPVSISCNIHPWMNAKAFVFDHPYFAVTDADGHFEFKNAPAGKYRLLVWHEAIGYRGGAAGRNGEAITIPNNGTADVGKKDIKP